MATETMHRLITDDEKDKIYDEAMNLLDEGREDEAIEKFKLAPLPPYMARIAKIAYGIDYLRNSGFNLAAAEAEYGKDWLVR